MKLSSSTIKLNLNQIYYELLWSGVKKLEGRLYKPPLDSLKLNDIICLQRADASSIFFHARVTYLAHYPSFQKMLQSEGTEKFLPGLKNYDEGVKVYHSFANYKNYEADYGALAIGLERLINS